MNQTRLLKNAKELRRQQTMAENKIWYHLRAHRYQNLKFKRQKPIGQYLVDFVCLEIKLIIEIDGSQHAEQLEYDQTRTAWLQQKGFHVLRFWNNEVFTQIESVLAVIDETVKDLTAKCPLPCPSPIKSMGEGKVYAHDLRNMEQK